MLGSDNTLSYDCLKDNQQYGFNAYSRPARRTWSSTTTRSPATTPTTGRHVHPGCGCTGGGKFWEVNGAVVTDNWVHGNHSVGLWADTNNRGFDIENNYIADNYSYGLIYEISYNALIKDNVFVPQRPRGRRDESRLPDERDIHIGVGFGQPGARSLRHHLHDHRE